MNPVVRNCVFLLFLLTGTAYAGQSRDFDAMMQKATEHYQHKQYEEALGLWYSLEASGQIHAGLYYNIGVAESSLHHTVEAVTAFEKALRLKPLDKKINDALAEERKKIENAIIAVHPFFLGRWFAGFLSLFRPGFWSMAGLLLILIVVGCWLATDSIRRFIPSYTGWLVRALLGAGLLCLIFGSLAYTRITRKDEGIIHTACDFRQAPSDESPKMLVLYPGEKVRIKDQIGNWKLVQLLNLDEGWVTTNCIKVIEVKLR